MTNSDLPPQITDSKTENSSDEVESVVAKISNDEVIANGCLVVPGGKQATLYPFADDRAFGILIDINIVQELSEKLRATISVNSDKLISVHITRTFFQGKPSVHTNIAVSQTDGHRYFLSIIISMIGGPDNFFYDLRYHVSRRPK